jgi:hypothetical protein
MHPQIFNFANYQACVRLSVMYSFSFSTAALNGYDVDDNKEDAGVRGDGGSTTEKVAVTVAPPPPTLDSSPSTTPTVSTTVSTTKAAAAPVDIALKNPVPAGIVVYAAASSFNHSCEPNVAWTHLPEAPNVIVLVAKRAIAKGEQLCVSYIDETADYARRRQALRSYNFDCPCGRCVAKR